MLTADGREFGSSDDSLARRRVPPGRSSKVAQENLSTLEIQPMVILALGRARPLCASVFPAMEEQINTDLLYKVLLSP